MAAALAFFLLGGAPPVFAAPSPDRSGGWCAKPPSTHDENEKKGYDKLLETTTLVKSTSALWPTKTIPYIIDGALDLAEWEETIRIAAKEIRELTGVALVSCKFEAIQGVPEISGFIVFTSAERGDCPFADEKKDRRRCCADAGYRPRTRSILIGDVVLAHKEFGVQIGLEKPCSLGVIMHEVLHALGLAHQQENPQAARYIDVKKPKDSNGCRPDANNPWISQYDPASIMHYPLQSPTCDLHLKCSEKAKGNTTELTCEIDELVNSKSLCGYRGQGACVKREGRLWSPNPNLKCLSVFDQIWLVKSYAEKTNDKFGIGDLISKNVCTMP
jgi:hypothetical protein